MEEELEKTLNSNGNENNEETVTVTENNANIVIFNRFANVYLNGLISFENVNPIVDFILNVNLSDKLNLDFINLFIDSEGGDFYSAMKLVDVIRMSEIPIRTIGWGNVASAGLIIFMTGKQRFLSENCSILSHNATFNASSYSVKVTDMSHQHEFKLVTDRVMKIYMECTGKNEKYIKKHLLKENDVYLSAVDAIKHGLGDNLIPKNISWLKTF